MEKIGKVVSIGFRTFLDQKAIDKINEIDHEKFRLRLCYNIDELLEKSLKKNFICLIAHIDSDPVAFFYGYDDEFDSHCFFWMR